MAAGWQSLPAVRAGNVHLADGNAYFNRSGPRVVHSAEIAAEMMWPELQRAVGPPRRSLAACGCPADVAEDEGRQRRPHVVALAEFRMQRDVTWQDTRCVWRRLATIGCRGTVLQQYCSEIATPQ